MSQSVDQKLIKGTKFPPEFKRKVDMKKVNIEVMKKWIAGKISELLGHDDDVLVEFCFNLLEASRYPDIKDIQIQLTGFLDKDAAPFCKELWNLCISAEANAQGVPKELLEAKKLELIQEKIKAEKEAEETRRRREQERARDRELDLIRQRERGERNRGRGPRGGYRADRHFDRRRASRSPPRRRSPPPRREMDSYVPRGGGRREDRRRFRSPSPRRSVSPARGPRSPSPRRRRRRSPTRSASRSSTPPRRRARSLETSRSRSLTPSRDRPRQDFRDRRTRSRSRSRGRRDDDRNQRRNSPRSSSHSRRSRSHSPRRNRKSRSSSPASNISRSRSRSQRPRNGRRPDINDRSLSSDRDLGTKDNRRVQSPYSTDDEVRKSRADVRKDQDNGGRKHSRSRSDSRRPRRQRRRLPSVERYQPHAKRRRNTSSPESDD